MREEYLEHRLKHGEPEAYDEISRLRAENERLREALDEAIRDLVCTRNSAWHAAQTDHRWKGVSAELNRRIEACRIALRRTKARGQ